jgi:hypothetical protein
MTERPSESNPSKRPDEFPPCKNCGEPWDAPKKAVGGTACDYYEPGLADQNPSSDPPGADLFDDPRYTIEALDELQAAVMRFLDRYPQKDATRMTREWDGLDLPSVVPVLREATRMIDLLSGHDWEGEP